jgi:AcrR family transcriptional regulator
MVLGAVLDLVAEGTLDEVSVPAVARRSGVSVATIYRYFPSKDDLLAAAAAEPSRLALTSTDRPASQPGDDEFATFLRAMWHEFSGNLPLLRHQISSEAGRAMRRARLADGRDRLAAYVEAFGVDSSSVDGERLISLIMLVSGSIALVELHDRQGLEVGDAIDTSLWAVQALIDATNPDRTVPDGERTT